MTKADAVEARRRIGIILDLLRLELHPEKTRLVKFRRPDHRAWQGDPGQGPGTFDLLGFTHYWGRAHTGKWTVKRRTARDRLRRAVKQIKDWCGGTGTNRCANSNVAFR